MKTITFIVFLLNVVVCSFNLQSMTAEDVINKVDANQEFKNEKFSARMVISKNKRQLIKSFTGYSQKVGSKSFMVFTNPEDKGVKYLKLENELYIYLPDAQDTVKISGHMLRQGMMGSDISYEDMLTSDSLQDKYVSVIVGKSNYKGRNCYHVRMTAQKDNVTYYMREAYIDSSQFVVLKVSLYAKSGRILKQMLFDDIRQIGGRYIANKMSIQDMTRKGSLTQLEFSSIEFDAQLPADLFTRNNLLR